jgi:hypothetical protein
MITLKPIHILIKSISNQDCYDINLKITSEYGGFLIFTTLNETLP